ncbi:MAG: GerMN domain-containing protein [Syntrophomonadaceae bacterium]|nr:GerMN domain-containing protein [Syntrophomonadaceae bacterium]
MNASNWKVPVLIGVVLLVVGLVSTGCGWWPFAGPASEKVGEVEVEPGMGEVIIAEPESVQVDDVVTVELFFLDEESGKLVGEKREIRRVTGIARETLQELLRGPAPGSRLTSAIPADTVLLDLNIRSDGRCIVDLSREFRSNLAKGPHAETLAVYALVNTLTQFPTVKEVQLLINQQQVETVAGQVDLSQPLLREVSLIQH